MRIPAPCLALLLACALAPNAVAQDKPYPVKVVADLPYFDGKDADPDLNKLDVYIPEGKKDAPVLFFIHGGGWTKGTRKKFENLGKFFAGQGIVTVATGYRLSPKVQHPAHAEDVARAFAWTYNNIDKYGGRKDRIFVSGHSAGGHLAALLGMNESLLKQHKLELANIRAVIPISGVFVIKGEGKETTWGKDAEGWKQASPMTHVRKNVPPFLILYAEKDAKQFHEQGKDLAEALKKVGVEASSREMAGRDHGTIVYDIHQDGDVTAPVILDFIKKHQ